MGKCGTKAAPNTPAGFADLAAWLQRQRVTRGPCVPRSDRDLWGRPGRRGCTTPGYVVSVVNPAIIHAYARTQLARSKTDRIDAELIARFTATQQPARVDTPGARDPCNCKRWCAVSTPCRGCVRRRSIASRRASPSPKSAPRSTRCVASLDAQIAHVQQLIRASSRSASGPARAARAAHHHSRHRRGDRRGPDRRALRQVLHQRAPSRGLRRARAAHRRIGHPPRPQPPVEDRPGTPAEGPLLSGRRRAAVESHDSRRPRATPRRRQTADGHHRRRHAETHSSRVRRTQIRKRRTNRRAPTLDFQHGSHSCPTYRVKHVFDTLVLIT